LLEGRKMKMLRAIVRPEKADAVAESLEDAGFPALTKMDVLGRGKEGGVRMEGSVYDELPKTLLMVVVEDDESEAAREAVVSAAETGNYGDVKVFVTRVEEAFTIRTGEEGL